MYYALIQETIKNLETIKLFLGPGSVFNVLNLLLLRRSFILLFQTHVFRIHLQRVGDAYNKHRLQFKQFQIYIFIFKLKSVAPFSDFLCILFLSENMWKYEANVCTDCRQ